MKYGRITLDEPVEDMDRRLEESIAAALPEDAATRNALAVLGIIYIVNLGYFCIVVCNAVLVVYLDIRVLLNTLGNPKGI